MHTRIVLQSCIMPLVSNNGHYLNVILATYPGIHIIVIALTSKCGTYSVHVHVHVGGYPEVVACRDTIYRIARNFRGRKLSRISRFSHHPRKFSPRNSRHATPIMQPVLTFRESFLCEMLLSYGSAKVFSLENFPLYGIHTGT